MICETSKQFPNIEIVAGIDKFPKESEFKIFKNNGYFAYDFKIGNLFIELNGMYWHCSPKLYNAEDIVKFPNNLLIKAKDKWEYDARKR